MATAQQLYREGKLDDAIEALNGELRKAPTDRKKRSFLFEMLCFAGDFDRAEKQIDILSEGGTNNEAMGTLLYRSALYAERNRLELFDTKNYPASPAEEKPPVAGAWNGKPFTSISDSDLRIGSRLEIFAAGDYMWLPFEQIGTIQVEPPQKLRDLLYIPARVKTQEGFEGKDLGEVLIPALSVHSWQHPDDNVRLGRMTEWCADEAGDEAPYGQKMILVDGEETPILELRALNIKSNEPAAAAEAPAEA